MIISLGSNLSKYREEAISTLDSAMQPKPVNPKHTLKYSLALAKDERLGQEAEARGMTLDELCAVIISKYEQQINDVLKAESDRSCAINEAKNALSKTELNDIVRKWIG